jgi:hypothetical protein
MIAGEANRMKRHARDVFIDGHTSEKEERQTTMNANEKKF